MGLEIYSIQFNHDTGNATSDAMTIRRNAAQTVTLPEWRNGVSVKASDSPAAYAIGAVGNNTIKIKARFIITTRKPAFPTLPKPPSIQIQAINPPKVFNPLGDVAPTTVTFNTKGDTGVVTMNVTGHLGSAVRVTNTTWTWQYRLNAKQPWTTFATTQHRIYVLLQMPGLPWNQIAGGTQLPWTEVLDVTCAWANGASTQIAAAGLITEHVFALGPGTITYDCPGGGSSHYTIGGNFNCTAFLSRLQGGFGNGQYVNCTDCGTIVSVFSNSLGCNLWSSRMGYSFGLNPILGIGSNVWQTACGWGGFSYHEVGWTGGCTQNDGVYDACLEVNGSNNPTTGPPFIPVLPKNMVFGATGAMLYRDRLASVAGRPTCNPQPNTRVQRPVV